MVALKDWGCAWQEEQQRISNQEAVRDEWFCLLKDALASVNRLSRPAAQPGMHSRGPTLMDKGALPYFNLAHRTTLLPTLLHSCQFIATLLIGQLTSHR